MPTKGMVRACVSCCLVSPSCRAHSRRGSWFQLLVWRAWLRALRCSTCLQRPRLLPHGAGSRRNARPAPGRDRARAPGGQVATLGKSGVSVGYYDTEEAAARAYDRAAIGLLGRDSAGISTNFALADYDAEAVPQLIGKTREEVKATLKSERAKARALP